MYMDLALYKINSIIITLTIQEWSNRNTRFAAFQILIKRNIIYYLCTHRVEPELCDGGSIELVVLASIAQSCALLVTVRCVGVAGRL